MKPGDRMAVIGKYKAYDYEKIDVAAAAIGFTAAKYQVKPRPIRVVVTTETAVIRYRYCGTDPTATEGHQLIPTCSLIVDGYDAIEKIRFIRQGGTSGVIRATFER